MVWTGTDVLVLCYCYYIFSQEVDYSLFRQSAHLFCSTFCNISSIYMQFHKLREVSMYVAQFWHMVLKAAAFILWPFQKDLKRQILILKWHALFGSWTLKTRPNISTIEKHSPLQYSWHFWQFIVSIPICQY